MPDLINPEGHRHLTKKAAAGLFYVLREKYENPAVIEAPADPVVVCGNCRGQLVELMKAAIASEQEKLDRLRDAIRQSHSGLSVSQLEELIDPYMGEQSPEWDTLCEERPDLIQLCVQARASVGTLLHLGGYPGDLTLNSDRYHLGKAVVLYEDKLNLGDPEAIKYRLELTQARKRAVNDGRPYKLQRETVIKESGVQLFLRTLMSNGPDVIGDETFQRETKKRIKGKN